MIVESLRLRGWTGIKRGVGLDEISVDFSGVSGLIALDGKNGSGKSSFIELLSPFNQLASRDGALSQHCFLKDSAKELCFSYNGNQYRTLLKINAINSKSEGFLWKNGVSEINGKISAYSKYIQDLLGSPSLFYSSVFCSQNSKKLSDMTTGKLKELFSEFLRLDRLTAWENTAKQAGNVVTGKLATLESRIRTLKEGLEGADEIRGKITEYTDGIEGLKKKRDGYLRDLQTSRDLLNRLKEAEAKNTLAIQRKADLTAILARLEAEIQDDKKVAENELIAIREKYSEIKRQIAWHEIIIAEKDQILKAADGERAARVVLEKLEPELDLLSKEIRGHQEAIKGAETILHDLKIAHISLVNDLELGEIEKEINNLNHRVVQAREKTKDLDLKDPACQSSTCSFIVGALAATEAIPGLMASLEEWKIKLDQRSAFLQTEKDRIAIETGEKEDLLKTLRELESQKSGLFYTKDLKIKELKKELKEFAELSAKNTDLQLALSRIEDLQIALQETEAKGKEARERLAAVEIVKGSDIKETKQKIEDLDAEIDDKVSGKIEMVDSDIRSLEIVLIPEIDTALLEAQKKEAQLQGELARLTESEKELEAVKCERDGLAMEVSEWTYLKSACSKNGLQAIEIDGAAPLITSFANDLLSRAFGSLYTVKFRTQDEEGREVLDIVTIGEDGEEILLDNLSGGQKVWILMALRLAMTLLSKEKGGKGFLSAFSDESDGPLDQENAVNYIKMYRSFMAIGGFQNFYFISHKPECRALADHLLVFEHGKSPYWG